MCSSWLRLKIEALDLFMMQSELKQQFQRVFLLQQQYFSKPDIEQLNACLNAWQEVVDFLTGQDLLGLADAAGFYTELLETYCREQSSFSPEQIEFLLQWQSLLDSLHNHNSEEAITALLGYLQHPQWAAPIDAEAGEFLMELLKADCLKISANADTEDASFEDEINFCMIEPELLELAKVEIEPEVTAMIGGQVGLVAEQWKYVNPDELPALIEKTLETIAPIDKATEMVNLWGINQLLFGFERNLQIFKEDPELLDPSCCGLIETALALMGLYLANISDDVHYRALIEIFTNLEWAYSLTDEEKEFLQALFESPILEKTANIVCETAKLEDLSLDIPDDVDSDLLQMMFDELPGLSEEFSQFLQAIIGEEKLDVLADARRIAHTLKGLASMVGVKGVATLTHALESILEILAERSQLPDGDMADLLLEAADCIDGMNESLHAKTTAPENSLELLQQLFDAHYQLLTGEIPLPENAPENDETHAERVAEPSKAEEKTEALAEEKPSPPEISEKNKEDAFVRISKNALNDLLRIAGETSTLNAQLNEQLSKVKMLAKNSRERYRNKQTIISELEQHIQQQFDLTRVLNQDSDDFDPLEMDRYNSIHSGISKLQEVIADTREVELMTEAHMRQFNELLVTQGALQKESLEHILDTRLLAVKTLSSRFQRILRQASRATGKKARLLIEGEDLLIDGQMLHQLADPLMHIIRNAVDHGLENAHQRFELDKPETGSIRLNFSRKGETIQVLCEDDGKGLDHQAIYESALNKGLIAEGAAFSENELNRLILHPGFSTKQETSQLSGRGIGMDVVHQEIVNLKGRLEIQSTPNKGCLFRLSIPSSALMLKALLVQCNRQILSLASYGVEQSVLSVDGKIVNDLEQGLQFHYRERSYPAISIETLTANPEIDYSQEELFPVLFVNAGDGRKTAVFVSKMLAHREVVFKEMGVYVPPLPGISGVTILSSGQVSPVIDLQRLIQQQDDFRHFVRHYAQPALDYHLPRLLVVDDSLSARKSTEILLKDSGYEVETAIDGVEALNRIQQNRPDLVITDLEMPRMTGMELASVIKSREKLADLPVIMITSRSTDRHRREAEAAGVDCYLTKPWQEMNLLEQVERLLAGPVADKVLAEELEHMDASSE